MPTGQPCPKCGYVRQPRDTAPDWQCPACGVAIEKYRAVRAEAPAVIASIAATPQPAPEITLASRILGATPDLLSAALFLWCWVSPVAWRPTLAQNLGSVVLMEFFVLHAGVFLGAMVGAERASIDARATAALVIIAFYTPVAGAFAYFNGGWWPFLAFAWLLLGRILMLLTGGDSGAHQRKRARFQWANAAAFYIVAGFAVSLLPVPALGFGRARVPFSGWAIEPGQVMCWGFLYFGAQALAKLLERARWIEDWDEAPASDQ
jgi:hypothetical protein